MRQRIAAVSLIALFAWVWLRASPPEPADEEPRFTSQNELVRPEGYQEWIFAGASLGMSYNEQAPKQPRFHNVYVHPRAYREYKQTGRFPERTILVLEILTAGSQASINRHGQFEDQVVGVEAAVKDSKRFPEGWAYFSFTQRGQPPAATARAFDKKDCWSCHREHAETDNVFTQFYPVLRRAR